MWAGMDVVDGKHAEQSQGGFVLMSGFVGALPECQAIHG